MRAESWHVFGEIPSTNDSIHEAALAGAPEGTIHLARAQSRGRGRVGRDWWSPDDAGLWMTALLRPRSSPTRVPGLALVAGRAARDAIQALVRAPIELYWPNDLYSGGRKLAGILGEQRASGGNRWIALGIGLNIDHGSHERPEFVRDIATSLVELGGAERDPLALGKRIMARFWPLYDRYEDGESLADLVGDGLAHVGRPVRVTISEAEVFDGVVEGLGEHGELRVRDDGGAVRNVASADIEWRPVERDRDAPRR